MTPEQRQTYGQKHIRKMKRYERMFFPMVVEAIRAQVQGFVTAMRARGMQAARAGMNSKAPKMAAAIKAMYETVGLHFAKRTTAEIEASAERKAGFGINEEWIRLILEYLAGNILRSVQNITDTTKADILKVIDQGINEGWGVDRMAYELERADFPVWRARMIVRTELVTAMNAGQEAAKEESPWETVEEWVSAEDFRTRPGHALADGQKIKRGERFYVAKYKGKAIIGYDAMTGPGDPRASAGNRINCRCAKTTRALRENGRLVRKRKISVILPEEVQRPASTVLV